MAISAVINTKNSAQTLSACLKSIAWADEIIVVDMHSMDDTVAIARKAGAKVFTFDDVGYVEPARNFALSKATGEYVLLVDADEEIPVSLHKQLETIAHDGAQDVCALARKNLVFGDWVAHAGWWPDYQIRFFKNGALEWPETIHAQPTFSGTPHRLPAREDLAILHHNYPTVSSFLERLNRYTDIEAASRPDQPVAAATLVQAFRAELMTRLFVHRGIEGGHRSVALSFLQAMYELVVSLKQWELHGTPSFKDQEAVIREVGRLQREMAYWVADARSRQSSGITKIWWKIRKRIRC